MNLNKGRKMQKIYYVTTSEGKVNSLRSVLREYGIEMEWMNLALDESRSYSLKEIAQHKVLQAYKLLRKPVVALDGGFEIDALDGYPWTFCWPAERIFDRLPRLLLPDEDRSCSFCNCFAYFDREAEEPIFFESKIEGTLAEEARGEYDPHVHWSRLALLFVPCGRTKTLAEMSADEYKEWRKERHSESYATKFAKWFTN